MNFKPFKEVYPLIESKDMKEVSFGKFQNKDVIGVIKKDYNLTFTKQELEEIFAMHKSYRLDDHFQKEHDGTIYYISCDGYGSYIISIMKDASKKLYPIGVFNKN